MKITQHSVLKWLDDHHNGDRDWLASQCNAARGTVNNWLVSPRGIPSKAILIIENLMKIDKEKAAATSITPQNLVLEMDSDTFDLICDAASAEHKRPKQWSIDTLRNMAMESISKVAQSIIAENIEDFADYIQPIPCRGIAAGIPTSGDELDEVTPKKNLGKSYVAYEVCGESMEPLIEDGSVIYCMKSDSLKNPYPKKGLIYAFMYADELTLKRYNTRRATADEIEQEKEYIYIMGDGIPRVKVLQSINPSHKEIIIDKEFEMISWYDPKAQD